MEYLAHVSPQNRADIQKSYNTNPEKIKEQVDILKAWIKQQRHLPQNQDDAFLGNTLLRNKFRIEQAKTKLENYYTLKGVYREFFTEDYSDFMPTKQHLIATPLPLICKDLGRLFLIKLRKHKVEDFDLLNMIKFSILGLEMVLHFDYCRGDHIIMDCAGMSMEHLKKINVVDVQKIFHLYEKGYSGRILSIELFNAPSFTNIFLGILKMALNDKIYSKIKIHSSIDSIIETHGKEYLPSDYGGDLEDIESLQAQWDKVFQEKLDFFKGCATDVSNEKLRVGGVKKDESFGVDGTFKKINID